MTSTLTQEQSLAAIQQSSLGMAACLDELCRRHGLRYSLAFGSLIGAVRHRGFIPWDDDIDILMPRPDLDRLIELAPAQLPPYYELQNFRLGNTRRCLTRLADTRTLARFGSYAEGNELSLWVDIFALDGIPSGAAGRLVQQARAMWHKCMWGLASVDENINRSRPGRPLYQQAAIDFCAFTHFGNRIDVGDRLEKYERALRRYSYENCKTCFCGVGTYSPSAQTWPRAAFDDLVDYEFAGKRFLGPRDYDTVLSATYGDYMALPPRRQTRCPPN